MRSESSNLISVALLAGLSFGAETLGAQWPPLSLPQPSPAASVSQTVGVSTLTIDYARPRVNGRKVWGDLVPYGEVWRAGANQNTTLTLSTAAEIGGKALAAGRYGLHMIPTEKEWTVILSGDHERWGSFGYDEKNDVVRFPVTPSSAPMTEALQYTFEAVGGDSAEIVMRWDSLRVALPVRVDTRNATAAALRDDLSGLAQFFWQPWNTAANYLIDNNVHLSEAETWIDRSIRMNENFANSRTKAKLLRLKGDAAGAEALIAKALTGATEAEMNLYGYDLMNQGKSDDAIAIFRRNVKDHPQSWNTYDSLAEALAASGKKEEAIIQYKKALGMAPADQKARIEGVLTRLGSRK